MITINGKKYFTLDEVVKKSGYQKGTIYNLASQCILSHPIRGLASELYPSQGLYSEAVFDELQNYLRLKSSGMKKREIVAHIKTTRAGNNESQLQILEAGR